MIPVPNFKTRIEIKSFSYQFFKTQIADQGYVEVSLLEEFNPNFEPKEQIELQIDGTLSTTEILALSHALQACNLALSKIDE